MSSTVSMRQANTCSPAICPKAERPKHHYQSEALQNRQRCQTHFPVPTRLMAFSSMAGTGTGTAMLYNDLLFPATHPRGAITLSACRYRRVACNNLPRYSPRSTPDRGSNGRRLQVATMAKALPSATAVAAEAAVVEDEDLLRKGIAEFYDESSGLWEGIWGDQMHHGYYEPGADASVSDHRLAQIRMIEEALSFAAVPVGVTPKRLVDVGCGIGGSSRYLARKYTAECTGITLSPVQAERAQALAKAQGLADKVSFRVADALNQPFADGQFDLVWSMESGEHMPDKEKFLQELVRVAAPGATIIIVTWCHRDLLPSETSLQPDEITLLNKICKAYYLPAWCSPSNYVNIAKSLSLEDIKCADWSDNVAPFWPAVIRSALTWRGFTSLLRTGWKTIKGALVMPLMMNGYKKGVIKFAIITCRKPNESS